MEREPPTSLESIARFSLRVQREGEGVFMQTSDGVSNGDRVRDKLVKEVCWPSVSGEINLVKTERIYFYCDWEGGVVIMIGFKNKSMEEVWRMVIVDRYKLWKLIFLVGKSILMMLNMKRYWIVGYEKWEIEIRIIESDKNFYSLCI